MSADLNTMIREYLDHITVHVTEEEIHTPTTAPVRRVGAGRGLLVAGAAAVVVLLIALIPLLLGGDEPSPATTPDVVTPTTGPATETTTPVPATTVVAPDEPGMDPAEFMAMVPPDFREGWTQPTLEESGLSDARLSRIFTLGDRLVGIGSDPENGLGTVWTSDDGLHWEQSGDVYTETATGTVPFQPFPQLRWNAIKVGGPGLVAVDKPGSVGAEVWVAELSDADLTWRHTASLPGACCFIDIAATEDLIVVVSQQVDHQEGNPGVWTSTDAYTWERVPPENLPFGNATHGLAFVEAGGPGFVGIGFGSGIGSSIYVSIDGTEWFSPHDFAETHPETVTESHIAIGHPTDYRRLCHSNENGTWICNPRDPGVRSEAEVNRRYVAVSRDRSSLGLSTDGRNWTWLPPTPETFVSAVPVDVVAWRGQIIVLARDISGFNTTWAWEPQTDE